MKVLDGALLAGAAVVLFAAAPLASQSGAHPGVANQRAIAARNSAARSMRGGANAGRQAAPNQNEYAKVGQALNEIRPMSAAPMSQPRAGSTTPSNTAAY